MSQDVFDYKNIIHSDLTEEDLGLSRDYNEDVSEQQTRKAPPKKTDDGAMELYDWVQCIVAALVCGILIFMFLARTISVDGSSMFPTLHNTDRIITSNLFYEPTSGDVVVFQTDTFKDEPLVKRVIATAGQTVDIDFDEGIVYVDGVALDEPYTNDRTYDREDFAGPVTVPEGCIFVMGDNRNASTDSRYSGIGMVDTRCVMGKVLFILIPGQNDGDPRDWSRIGGVVTWPKK